MHGVIQVLSRPVQAIIGPVEDVIAYARAKQLNHDDYEIVTDAATLHQLDPPSIERIVLCKASKLGHAVELTIRDEIASIKRLWRTIPVVTLP